MRVEPLSRVPVLMRKVLLTAAATAGFAVFGIAGASATDADDGLLTEGLSSETQSTTAALTEELTPVTDELAAVTEEVAPVVEKAASPVGAASESVAQSAQPVTAAAHEVAGAVASVADPVLESAAPLTEPVLETAADVVEPVVEASTAAVQPAITPVLEAAAPVAAPVVDAAALVTAPVIEAAAPVVDPVEETAEPIVDAVKAGGLAGETAGSNEPITAVEAGLTKDASSVSVAVAEVPSNQLADGPAEVVPADTAAGTSDNRQEDEREAAPARAEPQPTPAQFLAQIAHAPSAVADQDAHGAAGESYSGLPVAATPTAVPAGVGGSGTAAAGGSASAGQGAADVPFSHLLPPSANSGTADGSAWSLPASRSSDPGSSPD